MVDKILQIIKFCLTFIGYSTTGKKKKIEIVGKMQSDGKKSRVDSSVVDPNTLNLDPDPDPVFWPNLDPDPGLYNQF